MMLPIAGWLDRAWAVLDCIGRGFYSHIFWILSFVPGVIAVTFFLFRVDPKLDHLKKSLAEASKQKSGGGSDVPKPASPMSSPVPTTAPQLFDAIDRAILAREHFQADFLMLLQLVLSAVVLTVVLSIPAFLSSGLDGIGLTRRDAASGGLAGMVFAAYGAYVFLLYLLIGRLNTAGVSPKFLFNGAIRCAIAMVLGYMCGLVDLFGFAEGPPKLALFFLVGLFPMWAFESLQRRARQLFQPADLACRSLPLALLDGLDGAILDRLAEAGVADVQHLATVDPGELRVKTLYPGRRILDWMDQAILVLYVDSQIGECRKLGIRGAIDLATSYGDFIRGEEMTGGEPAEARSVRAGQILKQLSVATKITEEAVICIGRSLYEDRLVNLIWELWQDDGGESGVQRR